MTHRLATILNVTHHNDRRNIVA